MTQFLKTRKQLLTTLIFSLMTVSVLFICIPAVQNFLIDVIQKIFNKTLRNPQRWQEIIMHCGFILLTILWTFYYLVFSDSGKHITLTIKEKCSAFINSIKEQNVLLPLMIFAAFFLIFFKIITANFYYADDMWRNADGSRSWIGFSRYISEFFSILIHNSLNLSDIAPLTQFISIGIMAITVLLVCYISNEKKFSYSALFAISVTFISPFFSENFSYRFDSPYMVLAVFFPVFPFLFIQDKKTFIFTSIFSLLLTCFCYQAGLSVYILMAIFLVLKMILKNEEASQTGKTVLYSTASFVIALVVFKVLFMNTMSNNEDDYFSTAIKLSAMPHNLITYSKIIAANFGGKWLKAFTLLSIAFSFISLIRSSNCRKSIAIASTASAFVLGFLLSVGPYIIFERPLLTSRVFIGFNFLIAMILLSLVNGKITRIFAMATVYCCIVFQFVYGNCLSQQKDYQNFRCSMIARDIGELADPDKEIEIKFENSMDFCEAIKVSTDNYPILTSLITRTPSENSIWNENHFKNYNLDFKNNRDLDKSDMIPVRKTIWHDIYCKENAFVIVLK